MPWTLVTRIAAVAPFLIVRVAKAAAWSSESPERLKSEKTFEGS